MSVCVMRFLLKPWCLHSDRCGFALLQLANTGHLLLVELLSLPFHTLTHFLVRTPSDDLSSCPEHDTFSFILKEVAIRWTWSLAGVALEASCSGVMSAVKRLLGQKQVYSRKE